MYTQEEINENRRKWLDQLRDPEAGKTTEKLESSVKSNERCCLGHACHALGSDREACADGIVYYDGEEGILPRSVEQKLNITHRGDFKEPIIVKFMKREDLPYGLRPYGTERQVSDLIEVNDFTELTPQQIADVIEDQFRTGNFCACDDRLNLN